MNFPFHKERGETEKSDLSARKGKKYSAQGLGEKFIFSQRKG